MRKDLKNIIFETVSTLRKLFYTLKETLDEKTEQNKHLDKEVFKKTKILTTVEARPLRDKQRHLTSESKNHQELIVERCCHLTAAL